MNPLKLLSRVSVASFVFLLACSDRTNVTDPEAEKFFHLGWSDQAREIQRLPPKRQMELYFLTRDQQRPFNQGLPIAVAAGGRNLIPQIREMLSGHPTGLEQRELLCILMYMETFNYADIADDQPLMELAEQQVKSFTGVRLRQARKTVELIREHALSSHASAPPGNPWQRVVGAVDNCCT